MARDKLAGNLLASAATRALGEATIERKRHLARAAGSLEGMALVLDGLRQDAPRPIHIKAGGNWDRIIDSLQRAGGMVEGEDYFPTTEGIQINPESLPKLLKTFGKVGKLDKELAAIKSHAANTTDFDVPGFNQELGFTLKPQQQAAIRMFEKQGKVLGNLGVGLGKTITFGSAHARLMKKMKAEGKPHHGWYVLPANLVGETLGALRKAFPDMDIQAVSGATPEKRKGVYGAKHDLTIISSDTLRNDAEILASMCDGEGRPAAIYGDEVHSLFSPNTSDSPEDQSRRSLALQRLNADNMLVMTGTPVRQSLAEAWKILNWLHPGKDGKAGAMGGVRSFLDTFATIGQGTSAYAESQSRALRMKIDPMTITEKDPPKNVEHRINERRIAPSEQQLAAIRAEDAKYFQAKADGTAKKKDPITGRDALSRRQDKISEIMASGTKESNPLLKAAYDHAMENFADGGRRGILHCRSLRVQKAAVAMFPPGQMLSMNGSTPEIERERIKQALNHGLPIEGGAVNVGGKKGIVHAVERDFGGKKEDRYNPGVPVKAEIHFEDGTKGKFGVQDIHSDVVGMVGTSVTSTGLNLQGASWNVHLEQADSAATREQKEARTLRTGQKNPYVDTTRITPNTATGRAKYRQMSQQEKLMAGINDPAEYETPGPYLDQVLADHHAAKQDKAEMESSNYESVA